MPRTFFSMNGEIAAKRFSRLSSLSSAFQADVWYEPPTPKVGGSKTEPEQKKCRNPVVAALAFLVGLPVHLGAAANAETMALTGLWTAIPTAASLYWGMPIWALWLLGTECVVGCVLLRTASTLPARVRLVKQLSYLYSAAFILPFALLLADGGLYESCGLKLHRWAAFSVYLVGNITPFIWTINHCRRWRSTESGSNDRPEHLYSSHLEIPETSGRVALNPVGLQGGTSGKTKRIRYTHYDKLKVMYSSTPSRQNRYNRKNQSRRL